MTKRRSLKSRFLLRDAKEAFDKPQISLEAIKKFRKAIDYAEKHGVASEADLVKADEILCNREKNMEKTERGAQTVIL